VSPKHTVGRSVVSSKRLRKHIPETTDTQTTTGVLLETVFLIGPFKRGYKVGNWNKNKQKIVGDLNLEVIKLKFVQVTKVQL
jgi:hypothetical protein